MTGEYRLPLGLVLTTPSILRGRDAVLLAVCALSVGLILGGLFVAAGRPRR